MFDVKNANKTVENNNKANVQSEMVKHEKKKIINSDDERKWNEHEIEEVCGRRKDLMAKTKKKR